MEIDQPNKNQPKNQMEVDPDAQALVELFDNRTGVTRSIEITFDIDNSGKMVHGHYTEVEEGIYEKTENK